MRNPDSSSESADRTRKQLAANKDRYLKALESERAPEPEPEPVRTQRITYRGQTIEVPINQPTAAQASPQITYRGVAVDQNETAPAPTPTSTPKKSRNFRRKDRTAEKEDPSDRLRRLKALLDEGILTQAEFDEKKAELLGEL